MKKLIYVVLIIGLFKLSAEEMQLYKNFSGYQQFLTLTAQEQFYSIVNSFKEHSSSPQLGKWVSGMVRTWGREILPYVNETLLYTDWNHKYREPKDGTLEIYWYIFADLNEQQLLTEEECQLYIVIIKSKIKEYILKYRVIDGKVRLGYSILNNLAYKWEQEEYIDSEVLKSYYEKELGITGIVAGNMDTTFDVTPSPLAEYITD